MANNTDGQQGIVVQDWSGGVVKLDLASHLFGKLRAPCDGDFILDFQYFRIKSARALPFSLESALAAAVAHPCMHACEEEGV